jgi:hypothetical protein
MAHVRTILNFVVAGALLGVLLATVGYPRLSGRYNIPANNMCFCVEEARQSAEALINAQMKSCLAGAVVGAVAGIAFVAMRRKKALAAASVSAAPTSAK